MDDAGVERLAALFNRALAVPRVVRPAFVKAICGKDGKLRGELIALLEAHESSTCFLDNLAAVVAPVPAATGTSGAPDLMPELEAVLQGRYRIEQELGGGGMSRVFLAEDLTLRRNVVVKVLPPELTATMSGERFRREIQLAAQLQHPHIVPLLTGDASGRLHYYTMPFIAGESLRARLAREGALPIRDATKIWRDVLDALAHAHAHQVVHRDIKPGNILLGDRNALVTDFGIARAIEAAGEGDPEVTMPGVILGTPAYMAPEQVAGDPWADHRVDLYAAGMVAYQMIEGQLPFPAASSRELLAARLMGPPPPITRADCPPALAAMVTQCLARDPAERPESADALLAELETPHAAPPPRTRARRLVPFGLAALVMAAAVLGTRTWRPGPGGDPASPDPGTAIAVIPLANLSPGPADAALAEGMTEELVAILSQGGTLRVVASSSVRALRDRGLEVRQIADSLQVSHLIEGALQKIGSKLRLQVRLVHARDGSTRWSETYDRQIGDIFAVQDEIARAVADELEVQLAAGGGSGVGHRRYTPTITAYEWYLRGNHPALRRTAEGRRQGVEYLSRAVAADSGFAAAYVALVWMYLNETGTSPRDYREWIGRAEAAALKAVALDQGLADAHAALGWARLAARDWAAAETALTRAIAIDPAASRAYEGLARVYMFTRQPAKQMVAARRGAELDPFSIQAIRELALAFNMNGRCDETLELLRPLKDLDPPAYVAGVIRGQCYARKEMWPEAITEFRWALGSGEARAALAFLGYALARGGRSEEARAILSDLLVGRQRSHDAFGIAVVYAGLRDYDHAFTWLARSKEEGSSRVYLMDPLFGDLHRDPRFDRLWASRSD